MDRKPNKQNLLLTHWENATLPHRVRSQYCMHITWFECVVKKKYFKVIFRMTMLLSTKGLTTMTSISCLRCKIPIEWKRKWLFVSGLCPQIGLAQQLDIILPLGLWIFGIWWILTNILCEFNSSMLGHFTGHTTPKKRLLLTVLSTRWLEGKTK